MKIVVSDSKRHQYKLNSTPTTKLKPQASPQTAKFQRLHQACENYYEKFNPSSQYISPMQIPLGDLRMILREINIGMQVARPVSGIFEQPEFLDVQDPDLQKKLGSYVELKDCIWRLN